MLPCTSAALFGARAAHLRINMSALVRIRYRAMLYMCSVPRIMRPNSACIHVSLIMWCDLCQYTAITAYLCVFIRKCQRIALFALLGWLVQSMQLSVVYALGIALCTVAISCCRTNVALKFLRMVLY